MSKQELEVLGQDSEECCPALLTTPLAVDQSVELAKVFKALGDPIRLRLLSMIASRAGREVCVCDLTPAFDLSQPTISHHLKLLRQAGLIDCERRGTWVYYWLLPEMTDRLAGILRLGPRLAINTPIMIKECCDEWERYRAISNASGTST